MSGDVWEVGGAYEAYVGRWSRKVAAEFLRWLTAPPGGRWLDVACGTGALTEAIFEVAAPARVTGIDRSAGFLKDAPRQATTAVGDATALPLRDGSFDAVVSGLALNFVPRPADAIAEFVRVAAPGGLVASYVWDYAVGMRMMRYFWDAAAQVVADAADHDEGPRFPICHEPALRAAWIGAGLTDVTTRSIEIPTIFTDFEDLWRPFLGGQGAAPAYLATLPDSDKIEIRERFRTSVPFSPDGTIALTAAAWAVSGHKPG